MQVCKRDAVTKEKGFAPGRAIDRYLPIYIGMRYLGRYSPGAPASARSLLKRRALLSQSLWI
jgi:hypothetical protein